MTKNELYDIEKEVNKNIDIVRNEQVEYLGGVEKRIDLMFCAVRDYLIEKGGAE